MTDLDKAIAAAREALESEFDIRVSLERLLAALDAAQATPAAAVPPERDWTMIQSGDTSIPAWVVHYANAIGAYMKGQNVQHWAVGPVQSREQAPPAAAVPEGYALVPVEPTEAMLEAAWSVLVWDDDTTDGDICDAWAGMLAAAAQGVK